MVSIIPQTEVRLLKTPLEKDEEHTLSFNNINSQISYFLSKTQKIYTEFTYQRETSSLVVPDSFDTINTCNYLMYKNNGFNNKYFYAFITKMEYVSENSTRIYFEIDSLQTWYFNINYNKCFVEREHVNDDTIGLHTVPEGLETGEYIDQPITDNEKNSFNFFGTGEVPDCKIIVSVTQSGISNIDSGVGRLYNSIYSGLISVTFPSPSDAEIFMLYLDTKFSESPVVSVFMAPTSMANPDITDWDSYTDPSDPLLSFRYKALPYTTGLTSLSSPYLDKLSYLDQDYTPVNKKLLCYPYRYFLIDNNAGQCQEFMYEYFTGTSQNPNRCFFTISGSVSVGCSIKLRPINYLKYTGANNLYSIDASKLPTCSWVNDAYTNYLTANAVNIPMNYASSAINTLANAGAGNYMGAVGNVMQIGGLIGELYAHSKMPMTAHGGVNNGDFNYSGKFSFNVYRKSIKKEFAQIIDGYFSAYGYKVNTYKVPNITGRRNWNYVRTVGCNFTGDIPQEDLQKIKDIFNKGITFWHNSDNFLNYSVNNDII